jgi:cell division septal protein FtsQ
MARREPNFESKIKSRFEPPQVSKKALSKEQMPLSTSLIWIFLSTCLISGTATLAWLYYVYLGKLRIHDDQYLIKAIVQTGPQREALRTAYLEELLNLSADQPTNLYALDPKVAVQCLLASPVIKQARANRLPPDTLLIDYTVRQPVAILLDYTNTAIDTEGMPFPILPFFTPKKLPEIYLGLPQLASLPDGKQELPWSTPLSSKEASLALKLITLLSAPAYRDHFPLMRVDASQAYAESYGQRQIVVILENPYRVLRLGTEDYLQALGNYLELKTKLLPEDSLIDLRIPRLAYISRTK